MRRPCKGRGMGCMWLLLPNLSTGGDMHKNYKQNIDLYQAATSCQFYTDIQIYNIEQLSLQRPPKCIPTGWCLERYIKHTHIYRRLFAEMRSLKSHHSILWYRTAALVFQSNTIHIWWTFWLTWKQFSNFWWCFNLSTRGLHPTWVCCCFVD